MFKKLKAKQEWKEDMVLISEKIWKTQQWNKNYKKSNGYFRT